MKLFKIIYIFIFLTFGNAIAQENKKSSQQSKNIDFTSDVLEVDEKTKIMTASGNVVITSENRKIRANKVKYDQNLDKAIAIGNVILTEKDGSIYESDKGSLSIISLIALVFCADLISFCILRSHTACSYSKVIFAPYCDKLLYFSYQGP